MEEKKLFLLDAYALIYRAYYALIRSPRITSKGFNTSAIFGFCNTLDEILRKENPGYIAVCFDPPGGKTFRHEVYPEYKAQRDKQPEDITASIPYIKRILEAYRIPVIEMPDFEADDVIGSLARLAGLEGFTTYMMTPDKDYGQLVDDNTYMYRPSLRGQGFEIRGPREVCERYGIPSPGRVVDLLALEGDASDNVPGCPGVGEKTAARLIGEWGTVENLLDHADCVKGALGAKIAANAEQIRFSKFLVTIKTDVPLDVRPEDLRRREPDIEALTAVFDELEFKTMASRLTGVKSAAKNEPEKDVKTVRSPMGSLFDLPDESETAAADNADAFDLGRNGCRRLADVAALDAFVTEALAADNVGISLYAAGEEAMTAEFEGLAISAGDGRTAYFPMPMPGDARDAARAVLRRLFGGGVTVVGNDIKRDMIVLRREGVDFTAPYFDTSVAHYLISPETNHRLSTLAMIYLNYKTVDFDMTAAQIKKRSRLSDEDAFVQSCEAADINRRLVDPLVAEIEQRGQRKLLDDIELPMVSVLAGMEWNGVRIDVTELAALSRRLTARVTELENKAYDYAGGPFNLSSPAQVGEILFGQLEIDPSAKKTKRGAWSTTEEVLEKYRSKHPIVDLILEIRGLRKLLATYVDALPKLINPVTGKIHTTFNQTVTATGRLSSTNPNLQNIPIRTDDGREIRRAFIPDRGNLLLSADYSQIELRLMASLSGDEAMVEAFAAHRDIHRATAAKIYHLSLDDVSDNQRRKAKTANFGIIYGISAFGLAERLSIPRAEAKELIEGYLATYPRVREYMDESIENARRDGYVTTIMGRKRFLSEINSRNAVVRGYAERNAINAPLQGSAADIIKIAMIDIDREFRRLGLRSKMIIQVHDELVFDVVPDELETVKELVARLMAGAYCGRVALEVGIGVGSNWLEAH